MYEMLVSGFASTDCRFDYRWSRSLTARNVSLGSLLDVSVLETRFWVLRCGALEICPTAANTAFLGNSSKNSLDCVELLLKLIYFQSSCPDLKCHI
jgi:hypothetical protein